VSTITHPRFAQSARRIQLAARGLRPRAGRVESTNPDQHSLSVRSVETAASATPLDASGLAPAWSNPGAKLRALESRRHRTRPPKYR